MLEEQIILLIRENKHSEAIRKYVDSGEFDKAEEFCISKDKSLGLITTLLTIYFQQYQDFMAESKSLQASGDISGKAKATEKAQKYEWRALNLMRNPKAKTQLDPVTVMSLIPDDWDIITPERNLIVLLSSIFDQTLTVEENIEISKNLSKMEYQSTQYQLNELKSAYLVIGEESSCKVCKRKLKPHSIRIYPHGGVYHQRCAKDSCEDPITRQRFDVDIAAGFKAN
jgi:hypothetical protein